MATYEYQCQNENCHVVQELIQSVHTPLPEKLTCLACGGDAIQVILHAPNISRQGATDEPFDIAIGRDAEARWENIRERQAKRDKVRKESGSEALTMTGFNEFKPIPDAELCEVRGIENAPDTPLDKAALTKKRS